MSIPDREPRQEWIDVLKGLAIILVVMGHFPYTEHNIALRHVIYGFHMPLLFVLAGYTAAISMARTHSAISFIRKRFFGLMIPYVIWCFLAFPFSDISAISDYDFQERLTVCLSCRAQHKGYFWFLPCLFAFHVLYTIYVIVSRHFSNGWIRIIIAGILVSVGPILHLFYTGPGLWMQMHLSIIPFAAGVALQTYPRFMSFMQSNGIILISCLILLFCSNSYRDLPMSGLYSRVAGIAIVVLFSRAFVKENFTLPTIVKNMSKCCGTYSLSIYLFHYTFINSLCNYHGAWTKALNPLISFLLYLPIALCICYFCICMARCIKVSPLLGFLLLGIPIRKASATK